MKPLLRTRMPLAALLALLAGCASTPRWDGQAGDAVRAALSAQVANPQAGRNPDPVSGIDGAAAGAAQERYRRSFEQTQEQTGAPATMMGAK